MSRPVISRVSPAYPGETARIFGENLSECEVYLYYPDETVDLSDAFSPVPFPKRPEGAIKLQTRHAGDQVVFAGVPYTVPFGCCLIWVSGRDGEDCAALNRPEIWSSSLDTAVPGDKISLFGQNYYGEDQRYFTNTVCAMKNLSDGRLYRMTWGVSQDMQQSMPGQNDHRSDHLLPGDVPPGEYEISLTNGTGGPWGWSEKRRLTVIPRRSLVAEYSMRWNMECRQDVRYDLTGIPVRKISQELGDGFSDATREIENAVSDISAAGGGFVLLPPGRFGVTRTVHLLPGVILKGAGMGATTLTVREGSMLEPSGMPPVAYTKRASDGKNWSLDWKPYMDRDNNTPLLWIETEAGVEDLKLEGGHGAVILALVGTTDDRPSENVFFNRTEIENGINSALYLHGNVFDVSYHGVLTTGKTKNLTFYKCRVTASFPVFILPSQCVGMKMIGNTFEVSPRQSGDCVYASGLYGAVISENSFVNGRRTLISQQGTFDCYIFENRSTGVANTTNANEEYMSEYGQSAWVGKAAGVGENYIRTDFDISKKRLLQRGTVGENLSEHRWFLMIVEGRGLGQYRVVDRVEGDTVYTAEPWRVMPDENTVFNLVTAVNHTIWALNFAGMGSGNSQFVYGSGIENIVVGHSMLMTSGISMYAMMISKKDDGSINDMGIVAFNRFSHCDGRYSGMGLCLWSNESWSLLDDRDQDYQNQIGNIVRWSSFIGGADSDYVKNQTTWTPVRIGSGIQSVGNYTLFENNLIAGYDAGIHVRYSSTGNYLRNNTYRHNAVDIIDDGRQNIIDDDVPEKRIVRYGQRNTNARWYFDDGRVQSDLELH
ncbi:MAG: hypothetical protein IJU75_03680 [Clostridia bacterium]|nr:hypothetical protein [Clostridia bacterium]